jgi:proton-dependent oligopeptide transporter, POT family
VNGAGTRSRELRESAVSGSAGATLFGQPRGLATLFFMEMWERFTYYGMRAILILFMVAEVSAGGLGIDDYTASSIYGLFVACSYLFSLLGGWIADRLIGGQRAVIAGGCFIMFGNALLTFGIQQIFFMGLAAIALGVGLLKPNVSALVANLYPEGGSRRDAGFSLFYMGINVGALLGALLVPLCAARFGWRAGFSLPVAGMLIGLSQFILTRRYLSPTDLAVPVNVRLAAWWPVIGLALVGLATTSLLVSKALTLDAVAAGRASTWLIGSLALCYFAYLIFFAGLGSVERRRTYVMLALFVASTVYYAGIEQTGTSLTLFADRYTDRRIFGWEMPAGILQGVSSIVVILFAPLFSALWIALGRRGRDPSTPVKFAAGLMLMGLGFLVMYVASLRVLGGHRVSPTWLVVCYLVQMWGDLCLAPVGLSSMTKLAPPRFVGQVMGMWFLSIALGNNLAGQLATEYDAGNLPTLPALFLKIFCWGALAGLILLALNGPLKRLVASSDYGHVANSTDRG